LQSAFGDTELLREISELFLTESVRYLVELTAARDSGDSGSARRAAHTLKGHARFFGAETTFQLALSIEQAAAQGELNWDAAQRDLQAQIERLQHEVRAKLA